MTHITPALLDPFITCCVGRQDDYAQQVNDGHYIRIRNVLTYQELFWHLQGSQTLGTYVINENNRCSFAVFDSDAPAGLVDLAAVQMNLMSNGIPSYLEQSRRGAHLWVFFSEPIPAAQVRVSLLPFCPAGVEFYPKQDTASWQRPGSVIRLPLGVHRRSGERYPFVTVVDGQACPLFSSLIDALGWFSTIQRTRISSLPIPFHHCDTVSHPTPHNISFKKPEPIPADEPASTIRDWCASQDALSVMSKYVNLDPNGLGCCPFSWHHDDGIDTHPSFFVYAPTSPDICCWYCHVWQQGGSLFDFLCLYYELQARELWHHILSGAQF